jgi:hypothetical protein
MRWKVRRDFLSRVEIFASDERTASIRAVGDVMALVLTQWSMLSQLFYYSRKSSRGSKKIMRRGVEAA